MVKPNWDNFKAKFSENPQGNFEWFCGNGANLLI